MAKGAPKGKGKGPVVGYGEKGKAFHDVKKYNQSESGQLHAKNPGLSKKPVGKGLDGNVFFNQNKYNASKAGQMSGSGAPPGGYQPGNAGATTPMPGHPSQNPVHVHGPASTGTIKAAKAAPRAAAPRGMPGMK